MGPLVVVCGSAFHQLRRPRVQTSPDLFTKVWKDAAEFHAGSNGSRLKPASKRETHNFGDFSSPPSCSQLERQPGDQIVRGNGGKHNMSQQKDFTEESL